VTFLKEALIMSSRAGFTNKTPHTSKKAVPNEFELVKNKRVIHVERAFYRGSVFDGIFELESPSGDPLKHTNKGPRVSVICNWFGRRPLTCWPQFLLPKVGYEIEDNYTGKVVRNLSKI
jgi:hypothetical protein